jgi:hypothetical protein
MAGVGVGVAFTFAGKIFCHAAVSGFLDFGLGVGEGLAAGVGEAEGAGEGWFSGLSSCSVVSPPSMLTRAT